MSNQKYPDWKTFLVVDDNTPPKVELFVLDLDEPSRLEERQRISRMRDDFPEIRHEPVKLLTTVVILRNKHFIRNHVLIQRFFLPLKF